MTTNPTPSEQKAADTSLGDLLTEVSRDLSTLMGQEIELAKAELAHSAKRAGRGAGLLGAGAYAGMMSVLFVSIALWWGLGHLIDNGWSAVVVAALWALIGLILYKRGRGELKKVTGAPNAAESLKKIPETFTRNEENK